MFLVGFLELYWFIMDSIYALVSAKDDYCVYFNSVFKLLKNILINFDNYFD